MAKVLRRPITKDSHVNTESHMSPKEVQSRLSIGEELVETGVPRSTQTEIISAGRSVPLDLLSYPASASLTDTDVTQSPGVWNGAYSSRLQPENYETVQSDCISKELSDEAAPAASAAVDKARGIPYDSTLSFPNIVHRSDLPTMRSTESLSLPPGAADFRNAEAQWPRHLSFSIMDEALDNASDDTFGADPREDDNSNKLRLTNEALITLNASRMSMQLKRMQEQETIWIKTSVQIIEELNQSASKNQDDLDITYRQKLEEQNILRGATADLVSEERLSLTEALKDIEVLGAKLEYELGALRSKIDDVGDSVTDFERQVSDLETRALNLTHKEHNRDTWGCWMIHLFGVRCKKKLL